MKEQKLTWNDIETYKARDIANMYNWSPRKLEQEIRKHLDGASSEEIREVSTDFYFRK